MRVTEPSPGRVLQAADADSGLVATFTVIPRLGGVACRVGVTVEMPRPSARETRVAELVCRSLTRRILRRHLELVAERLEPAMAASI